MAVGAISSLVFGWLLDKLGFAILILAIFVMAFAAPFAYSDTFSLVIIGALLWGIGLGTQDSLLKAELTSIVPAGQRSSAYGIFDTGFGIGWFIGSVAMGLLYEISIPALMIFSVASQLSALPLLYLANKFLRR